MDGVGGRPDSRDRHAWIEYRRGRDLHRNVIHIARNVFVCRVTERLYARQTKTGQAQQRTHLASAESAEPDDGPREETLKHRSSA